MLQLQLENLGRVDVPPSFLRAYDTRLYDLRSDPDETENVAASQAAAVETLAAQVWAGLHRGHVLRSALGAGRSDAADIDADTLQELRDLGYIR